MSEYTDYFALLTEAETLGQLRAELSEAIATAYVSAVPYDMWPDLEAGWLTLDKPRWVVVAAPDVTLPMIAEVGPAVHIFIPEDWKQWRMEAQVGGAHWAVMVAEQGWGDRWLSGVDDALLAAGVAGIGAGPQPLADALGQPVETITDTLIMDGANAFHAALGIPNLHMLDQEGLRLGPDDGIVFDSEAED